jgi:hypothetical protein
MRHCRQENTIMRILKSFPLLLITVVLYNILAFLPEGRVLTSPVWNITLISGAVWRFTVNDLLICLSLILLYIEIFKATRTSTASIVDHGLSLAVFIICLLEFITLAPLGSSTFFAIMLITLIDVVAGFTITISTARRDFGMGAHANG